MFIQCPNCRQLLQLPDVDEVVHVTCPRCSNTFTKATEKGKSRPRRRTTLLVVAAALTFMLVFAVYLIIDHEDTAQRRDSARQSSRHTSTPTSTYPLTQPPADPQRPIRQSDRWITASYGDLVDLDAVTQTGQTLREVLKALPMQPNLDGVIQPHLDGFSWLLPHILDNGPAAPSVPFVNVVDRYPVGSAQPVWATILRSGRYRVYFDGQETARVFLLGEDPKSAYKNSYGLLRHILRGLASVQGVDSLNVEVHAYENDYAQMQLRLNTSAYRFTARSFPRPASVVALDLDGLHEFFAQQPILEGGQLHPRNGLMLFGTRPTSIASVPRRSTLPDLAVVYRAVFHAGSNTAFVSLDPHADPTRVTVNFGGFLEDTHVGDVVLEADKRFKTITSGLDADSRRDVRSDARAMIPSFLTSAERNLIRSSPPDAHWRGTRFWYYPESVEIDADIDYSVAVIRRAQFTADAERSREDYRDPEQFERFKKDHLSASIRDSIKDLNERYSDYAALFPELDDLQDVARLFGICAWLKQASHANVDLDALLTVEIPAFYTERERRQLVASTAAPRLGTGSPRPKVNVVDNAVVTDHTTQLERNVDTVFSSWRDVAEYLSELRTASLDNYSDYKVEARRLLVEFGDRPVADIVGSKSELRAVASYFADRVKVESREQRRQDAALKAQKTELDSLTTQIDQLGAAADSIKARTDNYSIERYNTLVDDHNDLVAEYESLRQEYNQGIDEYNQLDVQRQMVIEIGGGIDLAPDDFTIRSGRNSPLLDQFARIAKTATENWRTAEDGKQWLKSRASRDAPDPDPTPLATQWSRVTKNVDAKEFIGRERKYWQQSITGTGGWRDQLSDKSGRSVCRLYDQSNQTIHIVTFEDDQMASYVEGSKHKDGRIMFRPSDRRDVIRPKSPPRWHEGGQNLESTVIDES